ncbi:MAG: SDR family oxidoreductase [Bacteroidales bacterium]|nr:SDR family oxidoreductase [Clostridium sp.]MCM1203853.1 SDR family oxidoreductase [Bacteroidales bacterium]
MISFDLKGKKILITGGSSGIGRATAIACAKEGAQVIIIGRNEERLKNVITQMEGNIHLYRVFDFDEEENFEGLFEDIVQNVGKLDGMVHSAGILGVIPIRALSKKKMFEVMNVNYFSFVELVKQYVKRKYSNGGSIVGISSVVVERGESCQTIYSASKAALDASVKCLAIELASKNIRINTVVPGMIHTEMMDKTLENGSNLQELGAGSVLGIGSAENVANAIIYLLSDLSSHTTGRGIYVDGGCFL